MNDFLSFVTAGILLCIKTILAIILWLYIAGKYFSFVLSFIATIVIGCYLIKEYYKFFK